MNRTRAAIVAAAGAVLGVLTLRVLRNRGSTTDDGDGAPDDPARTDTESDTGSESAAVQRTEPTTETEHTPRLGSATSRRETAGDPDRTPRIRSGGPDRPPVRPDTERRPRLRPDRSTRKPRLRKVGKGWIRR